MIVISTGTVFGGDEYDGLTTSVGVTVTDDDDPPLVDFRESSTNVAENAGTVNVVMDLDPVPAFDTDLKYTVTGSATAGTTGDFTIMDSGTVLATGATTEIDVVIRDDDIINEPNETIILTLTSDAADNYDLKAAGAGVHIVHTITITDNDMPTNNAPTVDNAIVDQTATTGTAFSFPFPANTFADADNDPLTYTATKDDGTALPSWLTFAANTRTFSGTPGATDAGTLSVKVTANDGNMGTVSDNFDIVVSKPVVNITRDAVSVTEGTAASFTVSRTGPTTAALNVLLTASEDSTGGRDFVDDTLEDHTMVSIPIGSSSAKFTVATTGDSTDEPNGSVTVVIRANTAYTNGISYVASITVNDNDLPEVSITPGAAVTEGTAATFTVAREGDTTGALTVLLTVSEETTQGQDFVAPGDEGNDSIDIPAGEDDVTYSVPTTLDSTDEEHGHVTVAIRADATTYRIDSAKDDANVTVNDDDDPDPTIPVVSITRDASSVTEGTAASFTVTRTLATTTALIINLQVSEETEDGRDFVANTLEGSKTVTIPIGSATEKYTVATTDDDTDEPNGEVTVKLLAASNSSGVYTTHNTDHTAMITVNDNDDPDPITPVVSITRDASSITEGAMASFTVSRTGPTTAALTVLLAVSENNAGGRDFVAPSDEGNKMVSIPIGSQTVKFPVETTDDNIDEPNGSVTVALRNSANYTNDSPSSATVTVNDNDGTTPSPNTPMVSITTSSVTEVNSVTFIVSRTGPITSALTVLLTVTEDITQGQDFVPPTAEGDKEVTIPAGRRSTTYSVLTRGDDSEAEGRVIVTIRPSGGLYAIDDTQNTSEATVNVDDETKGTRDSLVHFGRTLGVQAVNTITDRLSSPRQFGLTGQVAGQTLSNGQRPNQQQNTLSTKPPNHTPGGADPLGEETTIATDTLQTGTAFTYTEETPNGTTISYWGQGTGSSFASASITDGKVTTLSFGTDWQKDKRTYGLMIARSSGDITYRQGSIERTMTTRMRAIIPYGGMDLANNLSLWGAFGLGQGDLTLKPLEDNGDDQTTDLDWHMVASGIRGDLASLDLLPGADLGWRADALWTRTSSDEQEGLPATRSKSTRLRVGLEMGWDHQLASSTIVRPYMGIDILHDGGDAETGLGVDVSGGVDWFDPAKGLTVGISGHKVIHHVDDAYESWGVSFSLAYDPRPETKEGFSAVVSHAVDREEVVGTTSLVGPTPDLDNPVSMDRSWQMEAAYGTVRAEGMVGSSYTRVRGSDDPEDLRVGYRIEPDTEIAEDVTVDTWASSPLEDGVASNAAGVDLVWRW